MKFLCSVVAVFMLAAGVSNGQTVFCIGNSLSNDYEPFNLDDSQFHIYCSRNLQYIFDNPLGHCVNASDPWTEVLPVNQYEYLIVQPFAGTTLEQDVDVISQWYQMQLNIGAAPAVVIHSSWTAWGTFPEIFQDGVSHCTPEYRQALRQSLEVEFPGIEVLFTRSSDMLFEIHQDGFDLRTTMGRDFIHIDLDHGREMMNQLVRYTIGQPVTMMVTEADTSEMNEYLTGVLRQMVIPGDTNFDTEVDLLDLQGFIDALINGDNLPSADVNKDGRVDLIDIDPFVQLIVGG